MLDFDRQMAIGIAFDISDTPEGRLRLIAAKKGLIDYATKLGLNCGILVGHPDNVEIPRRQGESVAAIARYCQPVGFKIEKTLKDLVVALGQADGEKFVVLVTDRYEGKERFHYEKPLVLSRVRRYGCKFLYIDLSEGSVLEELADVDCEVVRCESGGVGDKVETFTGV